MDLPTLFAMIGPFEPDSLPPDLRVSPAHLRRAPDLVARLEARAVLRRDFGLPDDGVANASAVVLLRHELAHAEALDDGVSRTHAWCQLDLVVGLDPLVVVLSDVSDLATEVLSRSPNGFFNRGSDSDARFLDAHELHLLDEWLESLGPTARAKEGEAVPRVAYEGGTARSVPPPEPLRPWPSLERTIREWTEE